jgi:hypothetical protein
MKILRRSQITEISVNRIVLHEVVFNNIRYCRIAKIRVSVPYMDLEINLEKSKIRWDVYISEHSIQNLTNKEAKELKLEEQFQKLDINDINGNGKINL